MRRPFLLVGVLILIFVLLSSALLHTSTLVTKNGKEDKRRATTPALPRSTLSSASHEQPRVVASAPAVDRSALAEAQLGTAALESNAAWIAAMHTAREDDLAAIKTGSNLQSVVDDVATLRRLQEHWRISVHSIDILWARVVGRARGQVLMHKTDESRVLYRHGHVGPLLATGGSYYSLYTLEATTGRWMVSGITHIPDARGAQLAADPPRRFTTVDTPTSTPRRAPLHATVVAPPDASLSPATPTPVSGAGETLVAPAQAVKAFYTALGARDYVTAFSWFTIRLQTQLSDEARWAKRYAQESPIVVKSATVLTRSSLTSTVAVTFVGTWAASGGKRVQLTYAGRWRLLHGQRGWRLDAPDNLHRIGG